MNATRSTNTTVAPTGVDIRIESIIPKSAQTTDKHPKQVGEIFRYRNLEITVTEMEERHLPRLHIRVLPEEQPEEVTE